MKMVKLRCFENKTVGNPFYKLSKRSGDPKANPPQTEIGITMSGITNSQKPEAKYTLFNMCLVLCNHLCGVGFWSCLHLQQQTSATWIKIQNQRAILAFQFSHKGACGSGSIIDARIFIIATVFRPKQGVDMKFGDIPSRRHYGPLTLCVDWKPFFNARNS